MLVNFSDTVLKVHEGTAQNGKRGIVISGYIYELYVGYGYAGVIGNISSSFLYFVIRYDLVWNTIVILPLSS